METRPDDAGQAAPLNSLLRSWASRPMVPVMAMWGRIPPGRCRSGRTGPRPRARRADVGAAPQQIGGDADHHGLRRVGNAARPPSIGRRSRGGIPIRMQRRFCALRAADLEGGDQRLAWRTGWPWRARTSRSVTSPLP